MLYRKHKHTTDDHEPWWSFSVSNTLIMIHLSNERRKYAPNILFTATQINHFSLVQRQPLRNFFLSWQSQLKEGKGQKYAKECIRKKRKVLSIDQLRKQTTVEFMRFRLALKSIFTSECFIAFLNCCARRECVMAKRVFSSKLPIFFFRFKWNDTFLTNINFE